MMVTGPLIQMSDASRPVVEAGLLLGGAAEDRRAAGAFVSWIG